MLNYTDVLLFFLQELVHVRQQLAHSRHKAQQLAKARDKLEIILHDFEAAASEEKEQMLVQLSAANQAVRQIAQQHEQAQQQLAKSQQALAVAECQLGETGHQLSETRRQLELLERRLAQAQQQLATSVEQQQQLEQRVAAAESAAAAGASGLQVQQVGARPLASRHRAHLPLGHQSSTTQLAPGTAPCACWPACLLLAQLPLVIGSSEACAAGCMGRVVAGGQQ